MYTFYLETEINKPMKKVFELFTDRSLFPKWQPGLLKDERVEHKDGKNGFKLTYQMGKRKIILKESILFVCSLPDGRTKWEMETEFRFSGLRRLIATYLRKGFEAQSTIIMKNFKGFAEHYL
jgi:hypothetical protein